jgi:hypothetical protein
MKHIYRSTLILRALTLILALSVLLGSSVMSVGAKKDEIEAPEASTYMTWEYFSTTDTISGHDPETDTTYRYSQVTVLSARIRIMPDHYYTYANKAEIDGYNVLLMAPDRASEFLLTDDGTLMATNEGKQALVKLAKQQVFNSYRLTRGELYGVINERNLRAITDTHGKQKQEYTLFDLRNKTCYTILGFNEDGWFGVPVGFVFEMEDGLYYASAFGLTDDCFDSDGGLQPKSGVKLSLYLLDQEVSETAYDEIRKINFHYPLYVYESGSSLGSGTTRNEVSMAFAAVVILGILLPAVPITLGLCFPHSRKMGYKKRWYLLAILGSAWLVLGIFTLVMTIACV